MKHLKALHTFSVAALHCNHSRTADQLCITHGAVSKQIKALESYLGCQLFQRHGRGLQLTSQGEELQHYCTRSFDLLQQGVDHLQQQQRRCIELSCEPSLTMRWLMPRLSGFYQQQPNADVRLSTAGGPIQVGTQGIDLAIRRDDFPRQAHYHYQPLVTEWVGPVLSPSYWQEIKNTGYWTLLHSATRPQAWSDWLEQHTADKAEIRVKAEQQLQHFYFCLQAAADGLGAAIGSYPLVQDDISNGRLIAPFGFVPSGIDYVLISQSANNAKLDAFSHWLKTEFASAIPPR